nr:four-carbon acid sugar kinase family protein [Fredinandcohnia onubensis]
MKIGIIADDLTGANDTGVKLAQKGIKTSVVFQLNMETTRNLDSIVYDTDTRYSEPQVAFEKVKQASLFLKENGFDIIYKKIDSTIRGNVGYELDAMYEVFKPDFIIIAPGYPSSGRVLKEGQIYLHGNRLDHSDYAESPTDKAFDYDLVQKLKRQSKYKSALFTNQELDEEIFHRLDARFKEQVPYLIFDSVEESDLKKIVEYISRSKYNVVWVGSSGLINYLPEGYHLETKSEQTLSISGNDNLPALTVIGSFNDVTIKQLSRLLQEPNSQGFKIDVPRLLENRVEKENEINRIVVESQKKAEEGFNIVIYASSDKTEVFQALEQGKSAGKNATEICSEIADALGAITQQLTGKKPFSGIVMTGGDTAKEVCKHLDAKGIELIDELSPVIPIGKIIGNQNIYTITKGGSIGDEQSLVSSVEFLRGNKTMNIT